MRRSPSSSFRVKTRLASSWPIAVGSKQTVQVIGVVEDIKEGQLDSANRATMYVPFNQDSWGSFNVVLRTSLAPGALLPSLASAIHQVDAEIPVSEATTMNDAIQDSNAAYLHRTSAWLVGGFAGIALLLAVVGSLRRDRLFGEPAHPRDWRAHGAGSATRNGIWTCAERGRLVDDGGYWRGIGVCCWHWLR